MKFKLKSLLTIAMFLVFDLNKSFCYMVKCIQQVKQWYVGFIRICIDT